MNQPHRVQFNNKVTKSQALLTQRFILIGIIVLPILNQTVDMSSACKKLEAKKSLIKLLQKQPKEAKNHRNEDKFKTISTDKDKKKSNINSASKTKRAQDEMKDLLKQSYMFVKEQNQSLANKLRRKMRKIQQMKEVIKGYEDKIKEYEEVMSIIKQDRQRSKSKTGESSLKSSRKYEDIIKQSQQVAKLSLDKYKKAQKQMEQQRNRYERQIFKLKEDNEALKQEIFKAKLERSEVLTSKKKIKHAPKSLQKENHDEYLTNEVKTLKQKQKNWLIKQEELKRMLNQINSKINNFQINCLLTEEKAKKYKAELDHLQQRYESKCRKSRQNNEKWHNIFKEFMKETQSMGKDIENVKKLFMDILKECLNKYDKN